MACRSRSAMLSDSNADAGRVLACRISESTSNEGPSDVIWVRMPCLRSLLRLDCTSHCILPWSRTGSHCPHNHRKSIERMHLSEGRNRRLRIELCTVPRYEAGDRSWGSTVMASPSSLLLRAPPVPRLRATPRHRRLELDFVHLQRMCRLVCRLLPEPEVARRYSCMR